MRYFVTGGAGFIGSNFVKHILNVEDSSVEVTVFDSLTYAGSLENLPSPDQEPRLKIIVGDVREIGRLEDEMKGHDVVVHFAAESHVDRSIESGQIFISTNVLGSFNVFQASLNTKIQKVIHVSTDEVYGSLEFGSADEYSKLAPNSPYAASKAASDLVARSFIQTYGLDIRITRCCNNFGPNQNPEKLIPLLISKIKNGENLPIYGDGSNIREWIHVDDHCRAICLVIAQGEKGEIYNIGSGVEISNLDLARMFLKFSVSKKSEIQFIADRQGHDFRYSIDSTKIQRLGFSPKYVLDQEVGSALFLGN
jgi:dTDP-glucose 4,6-dehydratase